MTVESQKEEILGFLTIDARLLTVTSRLSTGVAMTVHGHRAERLADRIRAEVAEIISGELKDPRIGFATVTKVDLSLDLHQARISVSVLGDAAEQQKSLQGLVSARGYVRHELGVRLGLRRTPELAFVLDHAAEENARVEELLEKLKKES